MPAKVVLDSNVLYSARLRDLWMELGVAGLVSLVWTDRIEAEWIGAVLRSRPNLEHHLRRTASIMRQVLPGACVIVDPADETAISLPDPDDRHVVAAVRASGAEAIVTFNVADFSAGVLGMLNIEIITPDACLLRVAADDNEGVLAAAAAVRARLRSPAIDATSYAAGLARASCPGIAAWLSARSSHF
jgi:predicted nucleic acid-binding protein